MPVIGSYYTGQRWIPCAWSIDGYYRSDKKRCGLDVVNAQNQKESA